MSDTTPMQTDPWATADAWQSLYRRMRNVAAGYSNYCDESGSTRKLEKEFGQIDADALDLKPRAALASAAPAPTGHKDRELLLRTAAWVESRVPRLADEDGRNDAQADANRLRALASPVAPEAAPVCPRPINTAPDDQPASECVAAGDCGCGLSAAEPAGAGPLTAQIEALVGEWEGCCDVIDKTMEDDVSEGESKAMRVCAREIRELLADQARKDGK